MKLAEVERKSLPRADNHSVKGTPRKSARTRWRVLTWVVVHLLIFAHLAHWQISGTTLTPLEPSEAGDTLTLGYINAGFLLLAISTLATLCVGRFFCGWACHVVAYQDACAFLLKRMGIQARPIRSRLLAFVPALAAIEMFVVPALAQLLANAGLPTLSWHLTTDDLWARFPGFWIGALTLGVDGFLVVYLLGSKAFCTYGCPYGAIFGLADRLSPTRIRVTDSCQGCGHCTFTCTSGVRVHEEVARFGMVVDSGCMKTLDCVSVCPSDALYVGMRATGSITPRRGKPRRRHDFSWPEEIAAAIAFSLSLWVWRGLYSTIPFLLAIGISVIVALGVVVLWRLGSRREMIFQERVLRINGRLSTAGTCALIGFGALFALTAHSGMVQFHHRESARLLDRAAQIEQGSSRDELLVRAESHLMWNRKHGLVETADLHHMLGSIYWSRGDLQKTESAMRRAVALDASFSQSRLILADLEMRRGAVERALDEIEQLLAIDPGNMEAARRLEKLIARNLFDSARPRLMLVGILLEHGRREEARRELDECELRFGASFSSDDLRRALNASD